VGHDEVDVSFDASDRVVGLRNRLFSGTRPLAVSSAIWATRWALSAICFDVARSSLIVVVISLIAVDCSLAPVAC